MKPTERHFTLVLQHRFLCWNLKFKLTSLYGPNILENERYRVPKIRCAKRATSFDVLTTVCWEVFPSGQSDRSVKLTSYLLRLRKHADIYCFPPWYFVMNVDRFTLNLTTDTHYQKYEGWNFNSGNYLFTTDTK